MLKGWLGEKLQNRAVSSGGREVRRFIEGLRKTPDRDLGVIVGIAAVVRVNMENHELIPERVFFKDEMPSTQELGMMQLRINHVARQFTRAKQFADATAAMIWSYSLRCLNVPELRPLGAEMWSVLRLGFDHAEEALDEGEDRLGEKFDRRVWEEWSMIPTGLETHSTDE
jgi:hypothetical protein